jgi:hypothetical protein
MKTHQEIWDFPWFSPSVLAQDMDQYDQPAKWMAQLKHFGFGSFLWTPGSFVLTYSTFPARYWNFCFAMWLSSGLWVISNSEWDGMGYARRNWQCIWRHSAGHQQMFHMFHPLQIGDDIAKSEFVKETERPEGAWGINRMVRVKIIYHPNWIVSYSKWNNFMDINCWRRKRYTVYGIPLLRLIAASTMAEPQQILKWEKPLQFCGPRCIPPGCSDPGLHRKLKIASLKVHQRHVNGTLFMP